MHVRKWQPVSSLFQLVDAVPGERVDALRLLDDANLAALMITRMTKVVTTIITKVKVARMIKAKITRMTNVLSHLMGSQGGQHRDLLAIVAGP